MSSFLIIHSLELLNSYSFFPIQPKAKAQDYMFGPKTFDINFHLGILFATLITDFLSL